METTYILSLVSVAVVPLLVAQTFSYMRASSKWKSEKQALKEHLNIQMEVTGKGNTQLNVELQNLKNENENLRITNATIQQKPTHAESREFFIYQSAIRFMQRTAPGFAPVWENALEHGEQEYENINSGITSWARRIFPSSRAARIDTEKQASLSNDTKK